MIARHAFVVTLAGAGLAMTARGSPSPDPRRRASGCSCGNRTAKAIGLRIPPAVLLRATRVID